ncbi:Dual specificity phosphatase, catalytic domain [Loktanella sp. DSM 29012]|uniref:phosphatase domain-containing putative toxin n=1 Tax=Loktanella sp. DSM 29012 TaxID=1881056 RepID=UPI0008D7B7BE|nr:Dual specificity phosphatase, catalytic domain [Loktanella sp. DSM 29012]
MAAKDEATVMEFIPHALECGGGTLAISPIPGRTRHYATDWDRLMTWGPSRVISMTTQAELDRKGAGSLGSDLAAVGIAWDHLPISDFGVPGADVLARWPSVAAMARADLGQGGRVLVHCFGGCGRSGMVVLRLMIEAGEPADLALSRLRQVRPCAVETDAQMRWATGGPVSCP